MNYRLENYTAKRSDQISHSIRITYKLYRVNEKGDLASCLGTDENLDRLLKKNERWMHKNNGYIIRKAVIELKEEPVFKIIQNKRRK